MDNQYYIANLSAKVDNLSIANDNIFHFVQKEKNTVIHEEITSETIQLKPACNQNDDEQTHFLKSEPFNGMDQFLDDFMLKISELKITQIATNTIFKMLCEFVERLYKFNCDSILHHHESDDTVQILVGAKNVVLSKLHEFDSHQKRQQFTDKRDGHVKSREICIGTQLKMTKDKVNQLSLPAQIRPTFRFFPVTETLSAIFSIEHIKKLYFDYNLRQKHRCVPGTYTDYCCGEKYQKNQLFADFPESIQLQYFLDAFEVCDALKSKAGVHAQLGVYFAIRNMPPELSYNMDNIFLVALCNSAHLKPNEVDYNNLWQVIVDDIRLLEDVGIFLDDGRALKGTKTLVDP